VTSVRNDDAASGTSINRSVPVGVPSLIHTVLRTVQYAFAPSTTTFGIS
jgi:hypothetical protein